MGHGLKISERLTELMNKNGLSNKELAAILGVTSCSVCRWKSGAKNMQLKQYIKIADYFGVSLDFLVGRERWFKDMRIENK